MEVYMVTYQYDDASDTSFKGLYATFQDAVDAVLKHHSIDPYDVATPDEWDTDETMMEYVRDRIKGDMYMYGRTNFCRCNYIVEVFEVGKWGNIGKRPANTIDLPPECGDVPTTDAIPSDFDMDDYMTKRF